MTDNKNNLRDMMLQNCTDNELREWIDAVKKKENESPGWSAGLDPDSDAAAIIGEARHRSRDRERYAGEHAVEQPKFIGPLACLGYLGTLIEWGMVLATLALIGNAIFG